MIHASKLMIGAYYLAPYASTPEHVRDLARCGIDVVVNMRNDRAALDLLEQHHVGAIVSGIVPGWFGGDGSNAGTMSEKNPLSKYELAADQFEDHPAILGIDAGDEPSSLDFPHYGKAINIICNRFPGKFAYLNIYPSYAVKGSNAPQEIAAQLGTDSYRKYIDRYVRYVDTPYICFDYYLYSANLPGLYETMMVVSSACRNHGKHMWTVLQVNSHQPEVFISEAKLRFQASCALAFGAEAIIWACYCAGWWHNHVLDKQGNKTEQYEKLRRVNAGLHRLGETYMQYRHMDTHFVGDFSAEELQKTGKAAVNRLDTRYVQNLRTDVAKLIVGQMMNREDGDGEALLIASANDPHDESSHTYSVYFESTHHIRAVGYNGCIPITNHGDNTYSFTLNTCDAILLISE